MGLKSMHAEKQSEQPQQSARDNSLLEQQLQRIAELERYISQIEQQSQKKDLQISEAISQAEVWKARADQEQTRAKDLERKLLEEQLNLKKTLRKKDLQASEAISQAEEWKNQAEKSEIQIQKLLSEKQELVSTVAEQGKRIAEQTEQIEKLNEADNVLKFNAELKKQNEKLKQEKQDALKEADIKVGNAKRYYNDKVHEFNRRMQESYDEQAAARKERESINQKVDMLTMQRMKEFTMRYDGYVYVLLTYGIVVTALTATRSERCIYDFKAFFGTIWQVISNIGDMALKAINWGIQLGDNKLMAYLITYLCIFVLVGFSGAFLVAFFIKIVEFFQKEFKINKVNLTVFLIELATLVWFAEPIRKVIPINLLLLLMIVYAISMILKMVKS